MRLGLFCVHVLQAVDEPDAVDDRGKMVGTVEAAPFPLGALAEAEDHRKCGLPREAAFGLLGPQPDGGKGGLDRVCNWYEDRRCRFVRLGPAAVLTYGATIRDEGHREHARWAGRSVR